MDKQEVLKYLKENEMNVQSAHAAIIALDLVYVGYIDSDKIHKVKYSPIFSYLCFKNLKPFFQIIPQKIITQVSRNTYFDYCKNKKSLDDKIEKHKKLEIEIDELWKEYQKNKKSYSEKEEFEKEEILVTSMTRIEFVPLMRKAKAIITDEGGIACHAAIISRELGIPCIIGTKNATRTLKTGNTVELDLKTGIIKVIT